MDTLAPNFWFILLTVGVIILGAAIVYGTMRNRQRTVTERVKTEVGTKRVYDQENRETE